MIYLFIIFCLLQCADIYTTWKALSSNVGHEANPVMAWLFSEVGLKAGLVIAKIAICIGIYFFAICDPDSIALVSILSCIGSNHYHFYR